MKKFAELFFPLLLSLLLLFGCMGNEEIENVLIGTWKNMSYQTGNWEKITFHEDLSYRLETYSGITYRSTVISGTYRYDEEQFILEERLGSDYAFSYSVSGDSLFTMDKIYLRQ